MADAYTGEIRILPYTFPPQDWASCLGQQVLIRQNPALAAVIGNQFGGDLQTYFNLPNLQGRVPVGTGSGVGHTWTVGDAEGEATVTLSNSQLPPHTHIWQGKTVAKPYTGVQASPKNAYIARLVKPESATKFDSDQMYSDGGGNAYMASNAVSFYGSTGTTVTPHDNMQPYLPMNFCICLNGWFPSRQ